MQGYFGVLRTTWSNALAQAMTDRFCGQTGFATPGAIAARAN
jgi:hypothetical protein